MRKKLALLLAALMASSTMLMACGDTTQGSSGTGSTAAGTSDEQEPVTITMAGESRIVTTLMAEKFNEQNPNITIEYKHPDGSGWISNEMLLKWAAAGDLPDIFYLQNPGVLVQNDLMLDLKPYYDADPDNQLFYQNLVQYSMVGDQMVLLPYSISFYGLMVNKDLIAANNLEVPDYDWTIDELVTIAQGLTRPGSQLGLYDVTFWSSLRATTARRTPGTSAKPGRPPYRSVRIWSSTTTLPPNASTGSRRAKTATGTTGTPRPARSAASTIRGSSGSRAASASGAKVPTGATGIRTTTCIPALIGTSIPSPSQRKATSPVRPSSPTATPSAKTVKIPTPPTRC